MLSLKYWINNRKKRNKPESSSENDVTMTVKRRKIKKTSAYNLFCPDFHKSGKHIIICERGLSYYLQKKQVESHSKKELC